MGEMGALLMKIWVMTNMQYKYRHVQMYLDTALAKYIHKKPFMHIVILQSFRDHCSHVRGGVFTTREKENTAFRLPQDTYLLYVCNCVKLQLCPCSCCNRAGHREEWGMDAEVEGCEERPQS